MNRRISAALTRLIVPPLPHYFTSMQTTSTQKSTNERVTGPSNGLIPLLAVIALTALTWGGIWTLHQRWYHDPLNPVGTEGVSSPEGSAPAHQ